MSIFYEPARTKAYEQGMEWDGIGVVVMLVSAAYAPEESHAGDGDIPREAIVVISDPVEGFLDTSGIGYLPPVTFEGLVGDEVVGAVFKRTTDDALVAFVTGDGFPFTPNGGEATINFPDGVFKL